MSSRRRVNHMHTQRPPNLARAFCDDNWEPVLAQRDIYSARSATIGSIRAALRAGKYPAISATTSSNNENPGLFRNTRTA